MTIAPLTSATTLLPGKDWALFLDVDGTLLRIAETPDGVVRDPELCRELSRLAAWLGGAVALISGRSIETLDRLFAPLKLPSAGLHGLERRDGDGQLHLLGEAETLDHLRQPLKELARLHEGVLLEDKGRALAVHYRLAPDHGPEVRRTIAQLVKESRRDLRTVEGKMVVEIKPKHADKGSAIQAFMEEPPFCGRTTVFVGDDVTDEDGFLAVNALGGYSIHVGQADKTTARYQLANVEAVGRWLSDVSTRLEAENRSEAP